jgi:general secretion pathway protein D
MGLMRYRAKGRSVCAGLLAAGLIFGSGGQEDSPKEQAAALTRKAKKAARSNEAADAFLLYSEASALQPKDRKLKQKMEALQSRAALQSHPSPPPGLLEGEIVPPVVLSPEDVFDSLTAREYAAARQPKEPPQLSGLAGRQDFDIQGNPRTLFDQVAKRFGLENIYDGDYPQGGQPIRFRITGVDYREALQDLEAITNSFVIPFSPKLFMVAQDTAQKRTDLEQTMVVSIPVPQLLTSQELTEMVQTVKQSMNIDKIAFDNAHSEIVIHDRISRVLPAQALLQQLMAYRPEVMIELEFLEVTDSDLINYGFNVTNQFSAIPLGRLFHNIVAFPPGTTALVTFGGGKSLIGLTVAQVQAMFNETTSTAKTLYRASVRAVDGQPSTFHVGERFPVITQQYAGGLPAGSPGVFAPPPSFTYEDLGAEVKVTPKIHGVDAVTLAVESTFQLLEGQSVNDIPIIGRREYKASVRIADGEWSIVAGLLGPTESKTTSGFWGLEQLPVVGNLFRFTTKNETRENLLIAIRPHLLSLPPDQTVTREVRVGTETRPYNPL